MQDAMITPRVPIEPLSTAYRVLNPGCVTVISVGDGTDANLFAVTWNMPVRKSPPMVALLSGKRHHSYGFIERTRELVINVLHADQVDALYATGVLSGALVADKWARCHLTPEKAISVTAPAVAEAIATLECRIQQIVDLDTSALLIAEVAAASADPRYWDGGWRWDNGLRLPHHLSGPEFTVSSELIRARKPE